MVIFYIYHKLIYIVDNVVVPEGGGGGRGRDPQGEGGPPPVGEVPPLSRRTIKNLIKHNKNIIYKYKYNKYINN